MAQRMTREELDRYVNRPSRSIALERSIIQDSALSSNARFLYVLLRSHDGWAGRDGAPWQFNDKDLMRKAGWKNRETLYRYRRELVDAGLVVKVQLVNEQGQFQGVRWEILASYPDQGSDGTDDGPDPDPDPPEPESAKTRPTDDPGPENPESGKTRLPYQIRNNPIQGLLNTPHTPQRGARPWGDPDPDPNQPNPEPDSPVQDDESRILSSAPPPPPKQGCAQSGLEGPGRLVTDSSGVSVYPEAFEAVWRAYRKGSGSKRLAYRAWVKVMTESPDLDLLAAVEGFVRWKEADDARQCARGETLKDRKRFWKDFSTWLNQACWEQVWEVLPGTAEQGSDGTDSPVQEGLPHLKMANFDQADYEAYMAYCARDDEERARRKQAGGNA